MRIGEGYVSNSVLQVHNRSRVQDPAYNELGQKGTQPRTKKSKKTDEGEEVDITFSIILDDIWC